MSEYTKERAGWLIYSREHNMWWRPNRCGYTVDIAKAGRHTKAQAETCCDTRGSEVFGGPSEFMIPAPETVARLAKAERLLGQLLSRHVALIESGDCGFWNPNDEDEVREARAFLEGGK